MLQVNFGRTLCPDSHSLLTLWTFVADPADLFVSCSGRYLQCSRRAGGPAAGAGAPDCRLDTTAHQSGTVMPFFLELVLFRFACTLQCALILCQGVYNLMADTLMHLPPFVQPSASLARPHCATG